MTAVAAPTLRIADDLALPLDAVTEAFGVLGVTSTEGIIAHNCIDNPGGCANTPGRVIRTLEVPMHPQSTSALPDSVSIPLYRRDGAIVGYTLVDRKDLPYVRGGRWCLDKKGYAWRRVRTQKIALHRLLLGLTVDDPREGDHRNRDRLDNRRSNLRVVTHAQNMQNRPSHGGASPYRGVSWDKRLQKWRAAVQVDGRAKHLGCFDSEEAANQAAVAARAQFMPYSTEGSR